MSSKSAWIRGTGQTVDELVKTDMRERGHSGIPDSIDQLYQIARERAGEPLSYAAATALRDAIDPLDTVLITTGAGIAPWLPYGETDGPPGAIGLANGLAIALEARPVLAIEERCLPPLAACARAAGLLDVPFEELQRRDEAVTIVPYPEGKDEADAAAENLLSTYEPDAVLAVEKVGPNRDDVISQVTDLTEGHAWVPPLFEQAHDAGIPTVGVGDRGNEVGFGAIEEEVREVYAESEGYADAACRVPTDHLVVSGTSNWGAYGIEAMLALITETPEALHPPTLEERMLTECAQAGAVDAISHRSVTQVDGTGLATQRGVVAMLNDLVDNRLSTYDPEHYVPRES